MRPEEETREVVIGSSHGSYVAENFVWREQDLAIFYDFALSEYARGNKLPLQASVLPIPSRQSALFIHCLRHNVIVRDPTIQAPERHLHDEEWSMLYSIAVRLFGPKETLMWGPQRDGPIRDYLSE